ncbi:MAG: SpoIIE family protein phosphatase [Rhodanobacteraceae bacterium]|nr:SpoIIE family protein phosphatase [Rhodanobacteraceae bacterium]MBK7042839.1 SpoIIE family protein phosphatase [Rhodanobacteraceae bacterium]MBP9154659.1 SpoIIE family protein phosphatase [Xanthomonadales bacterium]HQW80263.1 SpoIIE family protein phosphatase [Pseudomonadota bacterium]
MATLLGPLPISLALESGPSRADIGPLPLGEHRIGRAPENEIQLTDIAVSRQHALLSVVDGRWCLTDVGSTQGTHLNAQRLAAQTAMPLHPDDRVRIGPWTFIVRAGRAAHEPIPSALHRPSTIGSVPQLRLRALFTLVHTAQHAGDEGTLLSTLCRDLGNSLAYDRVALLRGDIEQITVAALHARDGVTNRTFSTTLMHAAEPEAPAVLESIAPADMGASLIAQPVAHAVCIRLNGVAEPTWLYLDRAEPFRDQDGSVLAYIEAAARIAALAISHREGLHAAAERERLAAEQSQARRVQTQLCASRNGRAGTLDYAFSTEPGAGMCGDFIDVLVARDGAVWCFVGDVVGHGSAAALLMATALAILRSECRRSDSPASVADHLAAELASVLAPGQFITLWLARIDHRADRIDIVDAGHGQAWLHGRGGLVHRLQLIGHPPIGVLPDARFQSESQSFAPGSVVVIATDGFTEGLVDQDVTGTIPTDHVATRMLARLCAQHRAGDDDASVLVLARG